MIHYKKDSEGIVTLTLDMANRQDNIINHEIVDAFMPVIEHLKKEKANKQLKGLIITSAKKSFLAGGDLEYLAHVEDPAIIFNFTEKLKHFFRDLEMPGVPVVAAINGTALGTGFELSLACHHRVVLDDPDIRLGLPEVKFGMMPGNGGVVRLMWLLGIEHSFSILTNAHRFSPKEAMHAGLIHEVAANEFDMILKAKNWIQQTKVARHPWDEENTRIPHGTAKDLAMAKKISFLAAKVSRQWRGNYPAPQAILNTLNEASKVDFDTALRIESRYYTQVLRHAVSKNMIKAFWFDKKDIFGGTNRPKGFGKFRPKKVGIIGAGIMGSGIAFTCARNGMEVILKDISKMVAERGRTYAAERLQTLEAQKAVTTQTAKAILNRIKTSDQSSDFESCDLVIEAVFENQPVKNKVTREAEAHMDEFAIFGSNTISIPITKLAQISERPENYVGLHFFAPAESVPLVEIVKGKKTSPETIARAFDFVRAIRKTPIVVKDDWGFYVMRVQNTYILEGINLILEGYPAAAVERLGVLAGMPKGPLALADEISLPIVLEYENQAAAHYGKRYIQHPAVPVLKKMISELNRTGKTRKGGFYDKNQMLWEDLPKHWPVTQQTIHEAEIKERLLFVQVIEAIWCLQEKVISSTAEANLGSIYGWGFPAFKGGVIQYIFDYGKSAFITSCGAFFKKYGPRYRVPRMINQLEPRSDFSTVP